MTGPWIAVLVVQGLVTVLLVLVVLGLLRRITPVLQRAEELMQQTMPMTPGGLPIGSKVPVFKARTAAGLEVSSEELLEEMTLLLFADASCPGCRDLLADLTSQRADLDPMRLCVVTSRIEDTHRAVGALGATLLEDVDGEVIQALRATAAPMVCAISADHVVLGSTMPSTLEDLREFAESIGLAIPDPNHGGVM